jgi:hypothetical protein
MGVVTSTNLIAGENLFAGDYVYVVTPHTPYLFYGTDPSVGRVYKTKRSIRARAVTAQCIGFVNAGVSAGSQVSITTSGLYSGLSGLTVGRLYQPSDTDGGLEEYRLNHPSPDFAVGVAISSTSLLLFPNSNLVRDKMYVSGGYDGSRNTCVEGFKCSDETGLLWSSLVTGRSDPGSVRSDTRVYVGGGYVSGTINSMESMPFSNLTHSSISSTLSSSKQFLGYESYTTKGYYLGGCTGSDPNSPVTTVDGITYSSETVAVVTSAAFASARSYTCNFSQNTKLYSLGGFISSSSRLNDVCSMPFSSESMSTLQSTLSANKGSGFVFGSMSRLYYAGGNSGSVIGTVERMDFSSETPSISGNLLSIRQGNTCCNSSCKSGYAISGYISANTPSSESLDFSTEVTYSSTRVPTTTSGRSGSSS